MAIIDFFDRGWSENPADVAYRSGSKTWTFTEARHRSSRICNAILARGFGPNSTAAVLSPNDPMAWICVLGSWRAGVAWLPLDPNQSAAEILRLLDSTDCDIVFFASSTAATIQAMRLRSPRTRHFICIDQEWRDTPSLDAWIADADTAAPLTSNDLEDVVTVCQTHDVTGRSRIVAYTHHNFSACYAHLMMVLRYATTDPIVSLVAGPMTKTVAALTLPATARGGTIITMRKPDPAAILDTIQRHRVTELYVPAATFYRLLDFPGIRDHDFTSLRYLLYMAAPMSAKTLRRAVDVFGPVLTKYYGPADALAGISYLRPEEHFIDGRLAEDARLSSCGRPYPLIPVEIRDDDGDAVCRGALGEICVRGDRVIKGYYDPGRTMRATVDGWLRTGDVGYIDLDGYLHLTDRERDEVTSGDVTVETIAIEQVVSSHPGVRACVVVGVPDDDWGEAVKIVVEMDAEATVSAEQIVALCNSRLSTVQAHMSVDFVPRLPRDPRGTVLKKDVRRRYWNDGRSAITERRSRGARRFPPPAADSTARWPS